MTITTFGLFLILISTGYAGICAGYLLGANDARNVITDKLLLWDKYSDDEKKTLARFSRPLTVFNWLLISLIASLLTLFGAWALTTLFHYINLNANLVGTTIILSVITNLIYFFKGAEFFGKLPHKSDPVGQNILFAETLYKSIHLHKELTKQETDLFTRILTGVATEEDVNKFIKDFLEKKPTPVTISTESNNQ